MPSEAARGARVDRRRFLGYLLAGGFTLVRPPRAWAAAPKTPKTPAPPGSPPDKGSVSGVT
ncbi:MAG TPA: hypothetical protein VGX75_11530, partial [bacterium]|nr:hypothetical protein [bacterium]